MEAELGKIGGAYAPCVQDGILKIRAEVFTGSPSPDSAGERTVVTHVPESGKSATVYLFTPSPDGRTLTLTQPQRNPAFKAVFEKQE